jgi:hypothetical protein
MDGHRAQQFALFSYSLESLGHEAISRSILGSKKGALSDVVVIMTLSSDLFQLSGEDGCLHLQ